MDKVRNNKILITAVVLFVLVLPLTSRINFYQNDDWVYYKNVQYFLDGDIKLDSYLGPTFYVQGFMAAGFAKLFGLGSLPYLTLLFSVANFFLISKIVKKESGFSEMQSAVLGLFYFISIINVYHLWGFMTGIYFMFFFLISIFLYTKYREEENLNYLIAALAVSVVSLFIRQMGMIFPLALSAYFLFRFKPKEFSLSFFTFLWMYIYYNNFFYQTAVMRRASLQFHHLSDFDLSFSIVVGISIVLASMLMPLILFRVKENLHKLQPKKTLLFALLSVLIFIFINDNFKPELLAWGEFPYFENTVERTGFFPRGIHGTKYHFIGNHDLYKFWDLSSKLVLSMFIASLFFICKVIYKKLNVYHFLFMTYIGVLLVTETFYDRYILLLIPISIFILVKDAHMTRLRNLIVAGFLVFTIFFAYQFSLDFISVNRSIWERSEKLVELGTPANRIKGTHAWNSLYSRPKQLMPAYLFSYDSPDLYKQGGGVTYSPVEVIEIDFPLNTFVNSKIHVYKLDEVSEKQL